MTADGEVEIFVIDGIPTGQMTMPRKEEYITYFPLMDFAPVVMA
jgi:hypothetical protein